MENEQKGFKPIEMIFSKKRFFEYFRTAFGYTSDFGPAELLDNAKILIETVMDIGKKHDYEIISSDAILEISLGNYTLEALLKSVSLDELEISRAQFPFNSKDGALAGEIEYNAAREQAGRDYNTYINGNLNLKVRYFGKNIKEYSELRKEFDSVAVKGLKRGVTVA